jgi:hypothetical protein
MNRTQAEKDTTSDAMPSLRKKIILVRFRIYYLTIFRIKTWIRRQLSSWLKFNRPSSHPFISGDGFRSLAQHVFDELSDINPDCIAYGDVVFVRGDFLREYFKTRHPLIKNHYILITHNSDENIDSRFTKYADEKIIHWFAQNLVIEHPKCTPIPIGIQLRHYDNQNTVAQFLKTARETNEKNPKIFYSFDPETNPKRKKVLAYLEKNTSCTGSEKKTDLATYFSRLSSCQFSASPEGNGIDCHRTWEALYSGSIPIVDSNTCTRYWYSIGVPLVIIDTWEQIATMDQDLLRRAYEELSPRLTSPVLYMSYWSDEITRYKK